MHKKGSDFRSSGYVTRETVQQSEARGALSSTRAVDAVQFNVGRKYVSLAYADGFRSRYSRAPRRSIQHLFASALIIN